MRRRVLEDLKKVFQKSGWQGFYRGLLPSSLRNGIVTGVKMASYEETKYFVIAKTNL